MRSKNNKEYELSIGGRIYQCKSNSRGTQLFANKFWYYYRSLNSRTFEFKRMVALWVDTEDGRKRITRETDWLPSISEVNNAVEDLRVDFRRGKKIYTSKKNTVDIKKPTYAIAYQEVCSDEKNAAIESGKDYGYKKIVSHHQNYVTNNKVSSIFDMYVEDITISDVKKLKNSINATALKDKKSRQTVLLIFGSIDKVLRHCYERNYTEKIIFDVPIKPLGLAKRKIGDEGFLTKVQFDELLQVFETDFVISKSDNCRVSTYRKNLYSTALTFLFYSGVRKGELFGMKWKDIQNDKFKVQRSLNAVAKYARDKDLSYREVTPKTDNGIREQTLPSSLGTILHEWNRTCIEFGFKANADDYIFLEANGMHFVNTTFSRNFKKIIDRSGIEKKHNKRINVHSLRHSACSYLVTEMKKKDPTASLMLIEDSVGQYLGHSVGGSMVREIYNHYYGEEEDSLLEKVLLSI